MEKIPRDEIKNIWHGLFKNLFPDEESCRSPDDIEVVKIKSFSDINFYEIIVKVDLKNRETGRYERQKYLVTKKGVNSYMTSIYDSNN
jgi:hypothetical protein